MLTEQEYAAKRGRVRTLVVAGMAALLGAYVFRTAQGGLPSYTPFVFLGVGLLSFIVAGVTAKKLRDDMAAK
jgi:hypothetical protein